MSGRSKSLILFTPNHKNKFIVTSVEFRIPIPKTGLRGRGEIKLNIKYNNVRQKQDGKHISSYFFGEVHALFMEVNVNFCFIWLLIEKMLGHP